MRFARSTWMARILTALLLTACITPAMGEARDPDAAAALLKRYTDPSTVLVGRVMVRQVDLPALFAEVRRTVEASGLNEREQALLLKGFPPQPMRDAAAAWLDALSNEGVEEVYVLLSLADFFPNLEPALFVVVPTADDIDATRVRRLLFSGDVDRPEAAEDEVRHPLLPGWTTAAFDDAVVLGMNHTLARLRDQPGHALPNLAEALRAVDGWAVQLLVVPTADTRRVMRELVPPLPDGTRPGPIVDRGMQWLALGLNLPPEPALRLRVQGEDAEGVQALIGLIHPAANLFRNEAGRAFVEWVRQVLDQGFVQDAAWTVQLDGPALRDLTGRLAVVILKGRQEAREIQTVSQMRQLLVAIHVYQDRHQRWPDAMDDLQPFLGANPEALLVHPVTGDRPGFEYVKPDEPPHAVREPDQTPMLYELRGGERVEGGWVGYVDGHVAR